MSMRQKREKVGRFLIPKEVMMEIEDRLLPSCIWANEKDVDHDELVRWAIEIIDRQLEDKRFR